MSRWRHPKPPYWASQWNLQVTLQRLRSHVSYSLWWQQGKALATTTEAVVPFPAVLISVVLIGGKLGGKLVRDHVLVAAVVTPTGWCRHLQIGSGSRGIVWNATIWLPSFLKVNTLIWILVKSSMRTSIPHVCTVNNGMTLPWAAD